MLSLRKFQLIEKINSRNDLLEEDKAFHCLCVINNISPMKLNNMKPKRALRLLEKMGKKFEKINARPHIGVNFRYVINDDITTFGRYIELLHFFQMGEYQHAHNIIASCCYGINYTHQGASKWALALRATNALFYLKKIAESLQSFNKKYSFLFEKSESSDKADAFSAQYGWIYSASKVAEYENISLEEAYAMPASRALHGLCYLKAKADHELKQIKDGR
jgi:hypothetical protein